MVGAALLHTSMVLRTGWNQGGLFIWQGIYGRFAVLTFLPWIKKKCKLFKSCTNQKQIQGGRLSAFCKTVPSYIQVHSYASGLSMHLLLFYPEILSWQIFRIACVYLGFPDIWECYQTGSHTESDLLCMHWTVCSLETPYREKVDLFLYGLKQLTETMGALLLTRQGQDFTPHFDKTF